MKFKFKMFAVAAAMATLAGAAHADLTGSNSVTNGSFALVAFNTVTRDWYIRDLGYLMNDFLPTGVNAIAADGGPATGDKSPASGLKIAGIAGPGVTVQTNFSDSNFAAWYNLQTSPVLWFAGSYDQTSASSSGTTRRAIVTSTNVAETLNNGQLDTYTSSGAFGGIGTFFGVGGLSKTGTNMLATADTGFGAGTELPSVGQSAGLFYGQRTAFTGASSTLTAINSYGGASLTLLPSGELTYITPVPLPATVWMMGAGLMAVGGLVRRRRAAAAEQA